MTYRNDQQWLDKVEHWHNANGLTLPDTFPKRGLSHADTIKALQVGLYQAQLAADRARALQRIAADEWHMHGTAALHEENAKRSDEAVEYIREAMLALQAGEEA